MKLERLKAELLKVSEIDCMELLEITTEDLVERFEDRIIAKKLYLTKEVELDNLNEVTEELDFNKD